MKEFTLENMLAAYDASTHPKQRSDLFTSFRIMVFHGFLDKELLDAYVEELARRFLRG